MPIMEYILSSARIQLLPLVCFLSCLTVGQTGSQVPGPLAVRDYCPSEYFNATCPNGHVILMRTAKYGRMASGRCVTGNHGFLGCSTDVLDYMDEKCGGRRTCKVYIAEPKLHERQPCPKDFASYLSAAYECVKGFIGMTDWNIANGRNRHKLFAFVEWVAVATGDEGECRGSHEILLTDQSGFVSAQLDPTSRVGSTECPWRVRVRRGQRMAIKLFKFGTVVQQHTEGGATGGSSASGYTGGGRSNVCYELATVKEGDQERSITTCSGEARESIVYQSESSMVDISIVSPGAFLLYYEAQGCAEPMLPKNVWIRRQGDNLIVKCNLTEETWSLVCRGNTWVGEVGNCSKDKQSSQQWSFPILATTDNQFPYGILILVAIGVALGVFLGGLLLSLAIFYLKRKSPHEQNTPPHLADLQCEHPKLLDGENNQIPQGTWGRPGMPHHHVTLAESPADIQRSNYMPACDVTIDIAQVKDCSHMGTTSTYDRRRADRLNAGNGNGTLRSSHHYESPQFT